MKFQSKWAKASAVIIAVCFVLNAAWIIRDNTYASSGVTAGIVANMGSMWVTATADEDNTYSDSDDSEIVTADSSAAVTADAVAVDSDVATEDGATQADAATSEDAALQQIVAVLLMADTEDSLNVRAEASTESEIVGKLRPEDVAMITGESDGWYQITSGNVEGYVRGDYCLTGVDAAAKAVEVTDTVATSTTGGLKVRSEGSTDASVVTALYEGEQVVVDADAEAVDGWVAVETEAGKGYVSAEYVEVTTEYSYAITIEEEQAEIKAAQEAEEAKKAKEEAAKKASQKSSSSSSSSSSTSSSSAGTSTEQKSSVTASCDDTTLLAALIQHECGNDIYADQLAVGAVVCNRVKSGSYPNTISAVIYQSGQFPAAANGGIANILSKGVKSSCMQAAQEALAGSDNTGGAVHFCSAKTGHAGTQIGGQVFW